MRQSSRNYSNAPMRVLVPDQIEAPLPGGYEVTYAEKYADTKLDLSWHQAFLEAYARSHDHSASAKLVGVHPHTVNQHRIVVPEFGELYAEVKEVITQQLEAEADRRALNGSDLLLIFRLKALRPEMYRDKYEVTVQPALNKLSDDELKDALKVAQKLSLPE